jgi:hypothetical protein
MLWIRNEGGDSNMTIKWFYKLLKVILVFECNDSENGQHDAYIQPNPSPQSLLTHP